MNKPVSIKPIPARSVHLQKLARALILLAEQDVAKRDQKRKKAS